MLTEISVVLWDVSLQPKTNPWGQKPYGEYLTNRDRELFQNGADLLPQYHSKKYGKTSTKLELVLQKKLLPWHWNIAVPTGKY